ncbi:MAG TPA: SGNH/GDSL hydrolase family protein [bacterium]|nr:SGNH/GDSL hydrolase family protein [bacterium]
MKTKKIIILRLTILFSAILIILLFIEVSFRIYFKKGFKIPKQLYIKDDVIGYIHNPNYYAKNKTSEYEYIVSINSNGLQDNEIPFQKNKNEKRFVFLGDSFTFGTGVNLEQTWHKIFIRLLNDYDKTFKYIGINCGVGGYNTEHEYLFFTKNGIKYQPDYVVICVLPNDIFHNYKGIKSYYNFALSGLEFSSSFENLPNPIFHPIKFKRIFISKLKKNLLKYSVFFNYLVIRFSININDKTVQEGNVYKKDLNDIMIKAWTKTEEIVKDLTEFCNNKNIKLILIGLPQLEVFQNYSTRPDDYLFFNKQLSQICQKYNIFYLNAFELLKKYKPDDLYFKNDRHLSIYGNECLGKELFEFFINIVYGKK